MEWSGKHALEWLSCAVLHYSRIDRLAAPLHRCGSKTASILMYHRVHRDSDGLGWRLTESAFRSQLRHLVRHYNVMDLGKLIESLARREPLPPRSVAVTFDDGYRDNYTRAFPAILEASCPTTVFLTAGLIDTQEMFWWDKLLYAIRHTRREREVVDYVLRSHELPHPDWVKLSVEEVVVAIKDRSEAEIAEVVNKIVHSLGVDLAKNTDDLLMNWDEARAMVDSGLVTMGAHTLTHRNLTRISLGEARGEITGSKAILEDKLDRPVSVFAYPFGYPGRDYNEEVKTLVREAGFSGALSTVSGLVEEGVDLFEIPRICESAEHWIAPGGRFSRSLFDADITGLRDALARARCILPARSRGAMIMTAAPVLLRTYQLGDELELVNLWNRAYARYAGYVPRSVEYWRWCILDRPGVTRGDVLLLTCGRETIAYGVLGVSGRVLELAIDPQLTDDQRRIASRRLVHALEERCRARGETAITFELPHDDEVLRRLMQHSGYRTEEARSLQVAIVDLATLLRALFTLRLRHRPKALSFRLAIEAGAYRFCPQQALRVRIGSEVEIEVEAYEERHSSNNLVDCTIATDLSTLTDIIFRRRTYEEARASGSITVHPESCEADARSLMGLLTLESPWYTPYADGR